MMIRSWGAGGVADMVIIAVFVPEAFRVVLGSGLLVSSAMPLWLACESEEERHSWSATLTLWVIGLSVFLSILILTFSEPLVNIVGPGLSSSRAAIAAELIMIGSWAIPGLALQALLSLYHYGKGSFLLPGLGSAFYNGVSVTYLVTSGVEATPDGFVLSLVLGSYITSMVLIPGAWNIGWRLWGRISLTGLSSLWQRLWPLLLSGIAGQAFTLVERMIASLGGEGMVVIINLTRKLINLPSLVILSISQVAMLKAFQANKDGPMLWVILRSALCLVTSLTWPMALVVIIWSYLAPTLITPNMEGMQSAWFADLLQCYAPALIFGGWTSVLTKFLYATGNTLIPTRIELIGTALQILAAVGLYLFIGMYSLPVGFSAGYFLTFVLLIRPTPLRTRAVRALPEVMVLAILSAVVVMYALSIKVTSLWLGLATAAGFYITAVLLCMLWLHRSIWNYGNN
jgi:peptidoglycan biosynthesis protein MviN/MurJ (putative lipid II flippase)